jgi:hypothetical protein
LNKRIPRTGTDKGIICNIQQYKQIHEGGV